jgi:plasmid stabilization system protein ParE
MTRDEHEFAKKITTYLDAGAAGLKAGTAYRLQVARQEALARLAEPAGAAEVRPALAGAYGLMTGGPRVTLRTKLGFAVGILAILAAVFGYQQWQAYQQLRDITEIDAAILSSDLPIDAYLDRGFQNWLKHVSSDED